ncbi:MAG TPA: hypothetical protein PKC76_03030 [Saprospiraceae bacterium]|nr:hypothetical protein [Saprospiraceae bacterium]HMP23076.1 hypothetical protein [Saprospiraceae bacterium]
MITSHTISIAKTAHYYTIGEPGPQIRRCWLVCHGYGQLARFFIRKFDAIAAPDTLIIAPEGLSRFYTEGLTGKVGASWMTKEDRLVEIEDYAQYLSALYAHFIPRLAPDVQIVLLGFSQGCATQVRWMMRDFPRFDALVLWAGLLPEDLDYRPHQAYFTGKALHFVYGLSDPFLNPERIAKHDELLAAQKLAFQVHTFEGVHTVDRVALRQLADLLA